MRTSLAGWLTLAIALFGCGSTDEETTPAGSVAVGGECRSNVDCASDTAGAVKCDCSDSADVPVCIALQGAGESCDITGGFQLPCGPELSCVAAGLDLGGAICVATASAGQSCGGDSGTPCAEGLSCQNGLCATGAGQLGVDCSTDGDCSAELRCDFMQGCVTRIPLGGACDSMVPTARTCAEGAGCDFREQTCTELKGDGADCMWDSECEAGVCSLNGCGADYRLPPNVSYHCGIG
jgi:hypothetical protein